MKPAQKSVKDYIRTIVDFPHEGIMFRDVTTLFADARGFRMSIDQLLHPYAGQRFDKVVGLEARGFILGGAVAGQLVSPLSGPGPYGLATNEVIASICALL